jgi:PST family polysaccharide transporter
VRGAGLTVLSSGISLTIQVAATVVLARILSPIDFGLVAMVSTFSLLLSNFGINGVTEAIVQQETLDRTLAGNLFWMTLCGGVLLTCGFAAAGSALAWFYGEPLVATVARGISLSILLTSLSVVHLALLKRAMHFSALAANDIVARAVSVATSIALGCAGWGYWALVAGVCALQFSTTIGAFFLCPWMPGRPRPSAATMPMAKFALYTYGRFGVNYFARNVDNLLVGWRFGAPALGFYKKAYDLFSLSASQLVSSISVVAVTALSRARNNNEQFRRYLLGSMAVMAFLGMGIAGDLTLVGEDLIFVLLGRGWGEAGKIFTWFAPGIGAMMLYGTHGWVHLSIGRADRWLRWGIVEWSITILLFLAAIHWGPRGIAVAWCISFWVLILPAMSYAGAPIGLGAWPIIGAVWRYVAAALAAAGSAGIVLSHFNDLNSVRGVEGALLRIALASLLYASLYLGAIVILHRGTAPIRKMIGLMREMVSTRREEKVPA